MPLPLLLPILAALAPMPQAQPAPAGAAEALGRCLVAKTTGEDRLAVARWLIAALASAPQVSDVVSGKPGAKEAADRKMAALFTRLLATDCAAQSRPLFAAGGVGGFQVAGEALGRIAVQELLTNPGASAALGTYAQYLDKEDFAAVTK